MKKVLVACSHNGHDTVTELPYVLHKAGLNVTLISSRRIKGCVSSFLDHWIESSEAADEIIHDIARIHAAYDWIILGDDSLLRALVDVELDDTLKTRLGPVRNAACLRLPGSKVESAVFASTQGIATPAFRICLDIEEVKAAATEIGFPVMVKIDRSGGGDGVFPYETATDIEHHRDRLKGGRFLVEKLIEGIPISVEPLYIEGRLLAYTYSEMILTHGRTGISSRRSFMPYPKIAPVLEKIGTGLKLHGFCNVTFIRETGTNRHYLIELDLRPNAWVAYGRFSGVDFADALREGLANPALTAHKLCSSAKQKHVTIWHRDIHHLLHSKDFKGLLYWLRNENGCWGNIPFYDPLFLCRRTAKIAAGTVKILGRFLYRKLKAGASLLRKGIPRKSVAEAASI